MNTYEFLFPDFQLVSKEMPEIITTLKNKKILITGATGFFGKWLLYYLIYLNEQNNLSLEVMCISRHSARFLKQFPEIAKHKFISWIDQDIQEKIKTDFSPDMIFHMATEVASHKLNQKDLFDSMILGARNIIDFANHQAKDLKILLASSGAVYGKQPAELAKLNEDYVSSALLGENSYGMGKQIIEQMCIENAEKNPHFKFVSARCFTFSGVYLPLGGHFALGNFVRDALEGKDLVISGNGLALRSYMYCADLVAWLITILVKGQSGQAYNVGSDEAVSIKQLAKIVCSFYPGRAFEIKGKTPDNYTAELYIPDIAKAQTLLSLKLNYSNRDGIARMIDVISQCHHLGINEV
jgi:nucleoside-diphosphate-sugar epimerase